MIMEDSDSGKIGIQIKIEPHPCCTFMHQVVATLVLQASCVCWHWGCFAAPVCIVAHDHEAKFSLLLFRRGWRAETTGGSYY
jgi:hypothetical protein